MVGAGLGSLYCLLALFGISQAFVQICGLTLSIVVGESEVFPQNNPPVAESEQSHLGTENPLSVAKLGRGLPDEVAQDTIWC